MYLDSEDSFYTRYYVDVSKQQKPVKQKEIITNKLVTTMVIIAIVKVAVLMLWI